MRIFDRQVGIGRRTVFNPVRTCRLSLLIAAVTCVRLTSIHARPERQRGGCRSRIPSPGRLDFSAQPTDEDVHRDYDHFWRGSEIVRSKRCSICPTETTMVSRPWTSSPAAPSASLVTDENLFRVAVGRMATPSLEHGNCDGSCLAFVWLGGILGTHFGDFQAGFRFGRLGVDLVERHGLDRFSARVYLVFGHVANLVAALAGRTYRAARLRRGAARRRPFLCGL